MITEYKTTEQVAAELKITTGRVRQIARALGVGVMIGRGRLFSADDLAAMRARSIKQGRPPRTPR